MLDVADQIRLALADRYRIDGELGRGGMAVVYRAEDVRHGRTVAIKVLRPELAAFGGYQPERFLREIRAAARLLHPGILPLHDSGESGGLLYFVMPCVEGETLRHRLRREGRLPIESAISLTRSIAAALDYAHRHNIVHRDIKPENILLHDGEPLIADFGIARAISSAASPDLATEGGLAVGTPAYMSPEQASADGDLDGRSDVYSLACVLYEMLAGDPPFTGPLPRQTMARHITEIPATIRRHRPEVSPAVEAALAKALAKEPSDRFATAAAFAEALVAPGSSLIVPPVVAAPGVRAVAVLPFVNASPDPDAEYLSDGITDELIHALAKVPGLRVASRTSVFALKGRKEDVRVLGRQLGVGVVLEGTVRTAGQRLRVAAQLSDAADGRLLWAERYDRELSDVFAIQDEIAATIVRTLRGGVLGDPGEALPRRYTENVRAYGLYLKGRWAWNKRSGAGVQEAVHYFEEAIAEDPNYALAYTGLADAHALQIDYRGAPVEEGMRRARADAQRAIALDNSLAEAHTSLAWVQFIYDWEWDDAERSFLRALELNPRYATARQWYAWLLLARGRAAEAVAEARTAAELDPSSVSIRRSLGWVYTFTREPEEALVHLRRAISMNPTSDETHQIVGMVYTAVGRWDDAEAEYREALALGADPGTILSARGEVAAKRGDVAAAREFLGELEALTAERYISPVAHVVLHVALGDHDAGLEWLERAYQDRRGWMAYLKTEPRLDPLRGDPRFARMVERMRL